ncbi:MAG: S8 family serine peptidase [Armatimonadota bacterium]
MVARLLKKTGAALRRLGRHTGCIVAIGLAIVLWANQCLGVPMLSPGSAGAVGAMPPSSAGHGEQFVPGRLLVKLIRGASPEAVFREFSVQPVELLHGIDTWIVKVPEGKELELTRRMSKDIRVVYAEPDHYVYECALPNDPMFEKYQWNLRKVSAPEAWEITTGSSGITIAVLDTGIDAGHPEFVGKLVSGVNALLGTGPPTDNRGHGTHVAGIAAALGNNGVGVAGVAWGAKIMAVKVLDTGGRGSDSTIARGINWAVDNGAKVVNLSVGGNAFSSTVNGAVKRARRLGVILIAAAGNDYLFGNPRVYPAAYEGVVGVGATNDRDVRASYSQVGDWVDLVAPGGDPAGEADADPNHWVLSTWARSRGTGYAMAAGTSQASPVVAGLAGLIWSVNPELTSDEVIDIIKDTAKDLGAPGWDAEYGYGRVDLGAAVRKAAGLGPPRELVATLSSPSSWSYLSGVVEIVGTVESSGPVQYTVQLGAGADPTVWYDIASGKADSVREGVLARWSTSGVIDGTYSLRIAASDSLGRKAVSPAVVVVVDNTPPLVDVLLPMSGAMVRDIVQVSADVTEPNLDAVVVQCGVGPNPTAWQDVGPMAKMPWGYGTQWDTRGLQDGEYTLRVMATDRSGNLALAWVTVTVSNGIPGDVDRDGKVTVLDAVIALRIAIGAANADTETMSVADVAPRPGTEGRRWGDGAVTIADALLILKQAVGLDAE